MVKFIRYLQVRYKERKQIISDINFVRIHLSSGYYYFTGGGKRIIYLKNQKSNYFIDKNNQHILRKKNNKKMKLRLISAQVLNILSRFKVNNQSSNCFTGSLVLITRTKDMKVFNFEQRKIRTFIIDRETFNKIKTAFERLGTFFPLTITNFHDVDGYFDEIYIEFNPYLFWTDNESKNVINNLFANYNSYLRSSKLLHEISLADLIVLLKKYDEFKLLANKIDSYIYNDFQNLLWPTFILHGDLGFHNILYSKGQMFLIDLENSSEHVFFYDLMNIIFHEFAFHDDSKYLQNYIIGKYDYNFSLLFSNVGLKFDSTKKIYYFCVFILERCISEVFMNAENKLKMHELCLKAISFIESYEYC